MTAYLGLGSNLGDRMANMQDALNHLGKSNGLRITGVSPVYETAPVGGPEQPDYLNAVAEIETSLDVHGLLNICLTVEAKMGRKRNEHRGARNIDIDILLFGEEQIETDRLSVPHPRMHERAFVLMPLADVAPQAVHPLTGKTVKELLNGLHHKGIEKVDGLLLNG